MPIENSRKITISEMAPHVHSFLPNENKVDKIAKWLSEWILASLEHGSIKPNDFLPSKGDLAFHIGVSLGTIQNVFRLLEDKGLIESRQKIGTYIKNKDADLLDKLTSKREVAVEKIKEYILQHNYNQGDCLISARKLSQELAIPFATIRIAINTLIVENILKKDNNKILVKSIFFDVHNVEQQTLVEKIAENINQYIKQNLKQGNKLPSNNALADMFNVSVKTIHDAIKILALAGIVETRRGLYGTTVLNQNNNENKKYFYEQVEQGIKKYIAENCQVGTRLPSIRDFSQAFNVSTKTIKTSLNILEYEGYIEFKRGRTGGTFVLEIPTAYEQEYTWLALSPEFETNN